MKNWRMWSEGKEESTMLGAFSEWQENFQILLQKDCLDGEDNNLSKK